MNKVWSGTRSLPGAENINEAIDSLRLEMTQAAPYWGYLMSTLNNPKQNKLEDSFSGHPISAMTPASGMLLILSICRCWEKGSANEMERPLNALHKIRDRVSDIENIRKTEHPSWRNQSLQIGTLINEVDKSIEMCESFLQADDFGKIRTFRTENLAHSTPGSSRDRKRFKLQDADVSPEYNQVITALSKTSEIIDRIISHWDFHIEKGHERAQIYSRYVDCFWQSIPVFRDVEDDKFV